MAIVQNLTHGMATVFSRAIDWLTQPERRVLSPYTRQHTPLARFTGNTLLIGALIVIGIVYGIAVVILPPSFLMFLAAPIALMALTVIWVLPDQQAPPAPAMVKCFFAFVIFAIVWPNYLAISLPGLPWISMRRLTLAPMCLLLLVCLSTSAQFRRDMAQSLSGFPLLWKALVAFVVVQTLSLALADEPVEAAKDYMNYQTYWTAVFFAAVYAFRSERNIHRLFAILIGCTLVLCVIGAAEWQNKGILWANHIPSFLQVDNPFLGSLLAGNFRAGQYRVATTFSHTLAFAEYLALITPIVIHFIFRSTTLTKQAFFVVLDIVVFALILSTKSRLGFGCFLIAHLVYLLFWGLRRWLVDRGSIFGPAVTLAFPAILAVFSLAAVSVDALRLRIFGGGAVAASNAGREAQVDAWLPAMMKSPPFGNGPRQGAEMLGTMSSGKPAIDNYYIWISLDYGVLGLLLYFGMIIAIMIKALQMGLIARTRSDEFGIVTGSILLIFLLSKWVLSQEDTHWLPMLLMGLTIAQLANAKAFDKAARDTRPQ